MEKNKENPTQQQMSRDLAEKIMGFRWQSNHLAIGCWEERFGKWRLRFDPFTSRDDAHELLGRLTYKQREVVIDRLRSELCGDSFAGWGWAVAWICLTATPAQIAEAVWRATCQ